MLKQLPVWIQERDSFSASRLGLKRFLFMKVIVRVGSDGPESSFNYAATGLDCWGFPPSAHVFISLYDIHTAFNH